MTYKVFVTETCTCSMAFDTEEEAFAVRDRINGPHEETYEENEERMEWLYDILPGWDMEMVAEVL